VITPTELATQFSKEALTDAITYLEEQENGLSAREKSLSIPKKA